MNTNAGYREIEHTADWQLEAWAPDLAGLLEQCARGMQALSGVRLDMQAEPIGHTLQLSAADPESLLVSFLSELLFISEQGGLGFERFDLRLEGLNLRARLRSRPLTGLSKEVKAVTYHNLEIASSPEGFRTRVVFDV
jgi:SHS2 domain-containing protein